MSLKPHNLCLVLATLVMPSVGALAASYRLGGTLGLGGTGIQALYDISEIESEPNIVTVKRANSPGVINFYVERPFTPRISLALEHFRGFKLAPFSSGVHFTGAVVRYFITPMVGPPPSSSIETSMHQKRISFFAGIASGVAIGKIERQGDLVPQVNSSGIFFSGRLGADYSISPDFGLRSEFVYGFTLVAGGTNPSNMQQFGIMLGAFLFL